MLSTTRSAVNAVIVIIIGWEGLCEHLVTTCASIVRFQEDCLGPVLGSNYGTKSFDMHFACEALFWRANGAAPLTKAFLNPRNCSSAAVRLLETSSTLVDNCNLENLVWAEVRDFMSACSHLVGTKPPREEVDSLLYLPPKELWAKAIEQRQAHQRQAERFSQRTTGSAGSKDEVVAPKRRMAQRNASVSEVQAHVRDPIHARWIGGPTYAQKLTRNPGSSMAWPKMGSPTAAFGYLFLRGKNGHCVKAGLTTGQCWSWSAGLGLGLNVSGALKDGSGNMACAAGDPEVPTAGLGLGMAASCRSPGFSLSAAGTLMHIASGLCVSPLNELSVFGAGMLL